MIILPISTLIVKVGATFLIGAATGAYVTYKLLKRK